jgi:hypothetical protein
VNPVDLDDHPDEDGRVSGANPSGRPENSWWREEYGSPCRECGFDWSIEPEEAIRAVEGLPGAWAGVLAGTTGNEVPPAATWSAKAYVFHVADNLRIFAERLEGVRAGGPRDLIGYDENELAATRHYEEMSLPAALWSIAHAVPLWAAASRAALADDTTFRHSEYGELRASEIVRAPAHDALHHDWDVRRAVRS